MALGGAACVLGLVFGSPAAAALGSALFAVTLAVWVGLSRALRGVVATRRAPAAASEGECVRVVVTLTRGGLFPVCFVGVTDVFGPQSRSPRALRGPLRLDREVPVEIEYEARVAHPRGIYPIGPLVVHASDPFGWFTRSKVAASQSETKVYPRVGNPALPDRLIASLAEPQRAPRAPRAGDSDEFHAVRDFRPGDLIRRIHWPSTARRGVPVVKEFVPTVQRELVLFLDVSRDLRFGGTRLSNFESSVRFVASLAARAASAGFRVALACGSSGAHDVSGGFGRGHYRRIVETLIPLRTRVEDSYAATVARAARTAGRSAVAVVPLHPYLVGDRGLESALVHLSSRGLRVACVAFRPRKGGLGPVSAARYRLGLARLEASGIEVWRA